MSSRGRPEKVWTQDRDENARRLPYHGKMMVANEKQKHYPTFVVYIIGVYD